MLAVVSGGKSITVAVLDITTINYWLCHRGAWFMAMLIPFYAITPLHDYLCKKTKRPLLLNLAVVVLILGLSCVTLEVENISIQRVINNVRHVLFHLPAFYIGFMLAPFSESKKRDNLDLDNRDSNNCCIILESLNNRVLARSLVFAIGWGSVCAIPPFRKILDANSRFLWQNLA